MGVSGIKGRPRGRPFAKGRSGNPGGRPVKPKTIEQRKLEADVRMLAFVHAEKLSFKKTVVASERDRPDVARRRAQWTKRQSGIDPKRLVFIDETWTKTNMEPLRGWAPRGERLPRRVPKEGLWIDR